MCLKMTKPNRPSTIPALALVALAGLVAQFLAARAAFALVSSDSFHPFFAALLIEAAVVADALATSRTRNEIALGGLILALVVSAIYNYAAAHSVAPDLHQVVKIALAVGPVLALASVGLALGEEVWRYEERVVEWQVQQDAAQAQADEDRRRFEREQAALDREHERKEQRRARLAQQKLERELALSDQVSPGGQPDRTLTGQGASDRSPVPRWPDKGAFLADTDRPEDLTYESLAEMAGVSQRTARRWLAAARNGKEEDGV